MKTKKKGQRLNVLKLKTPHWEKMQRTNMVELNKLKGPLYTFCHINMSISVREREGGGG